jgi:hypothetical protein
MTPEISTDGATTSGRNSGSSHTTKAQLSTMHMHTGLDINKRLNTDPFACLSVDGSDDDIDPMRITNFLWGVKAILTAFHANQINIDEQTNSGVEKSGALSNIWKFVSGCLDYGNNNQTVDSQLNALQLKATAILELQKFIENGVIEAVFSILAFTYLDVCQGEFGCWHRHLHGARSLLDLHCSNKQQLLESFTNTPGLHHAVTLLNWYDVTGVLASQDRLLIFEDWHREAIDDRFFSLVGCPKDIFFLFPELFKESPCANSWVMQALNEILVVPPVDTTYAHHAASAWRYAFLMTALLRSSFANEATATVQTLVGKICDKIRSIRFDTALSQHMAVVVYMAGQNAVAIRDRQAIRSYWQYWASEKFPLYADALAKCETRWEQMGIMMRI